MHSRRARVRTTSRVIGGGVVAVSKDESVGLVFFVGIGNLLDE